MAYYQIGELIKRLRKQKGLTQAQLAGEDIGRVTLSRIESGKQIPEKFTLDTLLERLGYSTRDFNELLMDEEEFKINVLRDQLKGHIYNYQTDEADKIIEELEKHRAFQKGRNKQFLLSHKASNWLIKKGDTATARKWLDEAIHIAIPKFNEQLIGLYHLSRVDVEIINSMADVYCLEDRTEEAAILLAKLADNIEHDCVDEKEKAKQLSLVLYNLSSYLGQIGRYRESLARCERAIELCLANNVYGDLPKIIFNKACCLYYLVSREASEPLFYQAYYGCKMMGFEDDCKLIIKLANEMYGIQLNVYDYR